MWPVPISFHHSTETWSLLPVSLVGEIADLFGTKRQAITKHLSNNYACEELNKEATCSILELVRKEGTRLVKRRVEFYNLYAQNFRECGMSLQETGQHLTQNAWNIDVQRVSRGLDGVQTSNQHLTHISRSSPRKLDLFLTEELFRQNNIRTNNYYRQKNKRTKYLGKHSIKYTL